MRGTHHTRSTRTRHPSGLERLEPIDAAPFRQPSHPGFIWSTIGLTWLLSLLSWRLWEFSPNLLLLVIACWVVNEPRRVGLFTAFFFGILMDVHDGTRLGGQALVFLLTAYGVLLLTQRIRQFSPVVQALHVLPVFLLSEASSRLVRAWLSADWAGWHWIWAVLLTVALWPLADLLLQMPQRHLNDVGSGSA